MSDDRFVCGKCFGDQGMKDFCLDRASSKKCDFCGAKSAKLIAAPLDDVIEHIESCVRQHFDDPANAGLPYETAEGGWQGETFDTRDALETLGLELPLDEDQDLLSAIDGGIENDLWCKADPYGLTKEEMLRFSWKNFCQIIKHQRRYFFFHKDKNDSDIGRDEIYSPADTLDAIFTFARQVGAFVELPAGTKLYRARLQSTGEKHKTAGALGPPPVGKAVQTNRMSPPGIVMTYVSEDRRTALAETADKPGTFAVGQFVNDRELLILDLTNLPKAPSPFAELSGSLKRDPRPSLIFLREVSAEISKPIARDDRAHIEYVPTQVVTEYVRTMVRNENRKIDGIRYRSSRRHSTTALVLFADQNNLILEKEERPTLYWADDRWLRLVESRVVEVTAQDIKSWAERTSSAFGA